MVSILEKLQYVYSAIGVLLVLGIYLRFGGYETASSDLLEKPVEVHAQSRPGSPAARNGAASAPEAAAAPRSPALKAREEKLVAKGVPREKAATLLPREFKVPKETARYLSKEDNWFSELDKASSRVLSDGAGQKTRLQILDIEEGSLLGLLGVKDNDIVSLIDGESWVFDGSRSTEYVLKAKQLLGKIERGEAISVTVERDGAFVDLQFRL
jgi:hypothetical protein